MKTNGVRHFLDLDEIAVADLRAMLANSRAMKTRVKKGDHSDKPLAGKTLAMIFEKPSTRTRVSFDVAMRQLGGEALMLTGQEMQLGRGETIADTAKVLSRYVDAIMIRILDPKALAELAEHATVPVINGLTRRSHPCQVMADVMTYEEHKGSIKGRTVAWTGDANNVLASWVHAAHQFEFAMKIATPAELKPKKWLTDFIKSSGADVELTKDPDNAVADADCVVTDTWLSMGDRDSAIAPPQHAQALSGQQPPDVEGEIGRHLHALPAGAPRPGGHRRGDRRPAIGGVRRGGKPAARPEGHSRLVPARRRAVICAYCAVGSAILRGRF